MPKIQDLPTADERRKATIPARRAARFKFAESRVRAIVNGAPPLTAEQRERLAALLRPVADGGADA